MKTLLYLLKTTMAVVWFVLLANFIWPWPDPYEQLMQLLFQATVVGHIACCAGFRFRQGKPLTWLVYQDMLLFGVFAILSWNHTEKMLAAAAAKPEHRADSDTSADNRSPSDHERFTR
ncbi:DUF1145 domain-containing protein [uncultured Ferrimonas sp.]|uniref:DUF1145 domain-containing protein n=1 Tax=uncultured Ferrimonas sp. TaxID=432640 RepID=UPI00261E8367|nr:DUF1145 domain-containing protein [uncultured Ferrimonas sp.]